MAEIGCISNKPEWPGLFTRWNCTGSEHLLAKPIRHSSQDVTDQMTQLIEQVVEQTQIPKEVLIRKKWLNALYQHVVFHRSEDELPEYLLGWRYEMLTRPLIQILKQDVKYLSTQMKIDR